MDTKGPINCASERDHFNFLNVVHFNNYVVIVPTPRNVAHYDVKSLNNHWLSKFDPLQNLITDRRTDYLKTEIASCSTLSNIRHSERTSHAPWRKGLL